MRAWGLANMLVPSRCAAINGQGQPHKAWLALVAKGKSCRGRSCLLLTAHCLEHPRPERKLSKSCYARRNAAQARMRDKAVPKAAWPVSVLRSMVQMLHHALEPWLSCTLFPQRWNPTAADTTTKLV